MLGKAWSVSHSSAYRYNAIISNDESWLTELDNESFRQLIALNKQTII